MTDTLKIHPDNRQLLNPDGKSLRLFQVKLFNTATLELERPIFVLAESKERAILQATNLLHGNSTLTPLEEKAIAEWSEVTSDGFMIQGWSRHFFGMI